MLQAMISLIGKAFNIDGAGNEMPPKARKGKSNALSQRWYHVRGRRPGVRD